MRDMQDPEMMREAQKMMQDPAFQAYMKQIMQSNAFQGAMKKTKDSLEDPEKRKEMEEMVKQKLEAGEKELKKAEEDAGADEMPDMGGDDDADKKEAADKKEEKEAAKPSVNEKLKETGNSGDLNSGWF